MENKSTTTYTPAKNSTGCREPTGVTDLEFIHSDFGFSKWVAPKESFGLAALAITTK